MVNGKQHLDAEQKAQKLVSLLDRMHSDPELRVELTQDSKALLREMDVSVPSGMSIKVVTNTAQTVHVVLPPDPNAALEDEWMEVLQAGAASWDTQLRDMAGAVGGYRAPGKRSETAFDHINMGTALYSIGLSNFSAPRG